MKPGLKNIVFALLTFMLAMPVQADVIGFSIGASYWAPELSGSFSSTGDTDVDISDDLGVDDPSESSVVISLEHPVPFLPNIKYQGVGLDSSGRETLSSNVTFEGQTYSAGETVRTSLDLSHDDIVLYYEVLDNWINLDIGVDIKSFDGEVSMVGSTNTVTSSIDVDETVPLLYLSAKFDLPFTGYYVGVDISNISAGDSSVEDTTIRLGFESDIGFGIEGGVRQFSLELDDVDNLDTDLEYDGAFINGFFHF